MKASLAAPLLLLTLSGCTLLGGGSTPSGDADSSGGESAELDGGSTACLVDRTWSLDVADAAAKLGAFMADTGMTVISTSGTGEQLIWFDEAASAGSSTDVTYTMSVELSGGLVMTMTQHHSGSPAGLWAWDGSADSTVVFEDWVGDYVITTDTTVDGVAAPSSTTPTGGGLDGQAMTISCSGDRLETQAEGSPFTQVWHAR